MAVGKVAAHCGEDGSTMGGFDKGLQLEEACGMDHSALKGSLSQTRV